jgi:drug efflux transport system permease protein
MSPLDPLRSLFNVAKKEMIQTLRDRRMVFTLIAAPAIQLVGFGYAVNLEVEHIPTVVCDQDRTQLSRGLIQQMLAEGTFREHAAVLDPRAAQAELESGDAAAAIIVPRGYTTKLARREAAQVQVIVDGTDAIRAQVAAADATQFLALRGVTAQVAPPIVPRILYNQRLKTPVYMVPGILASLLLNISAIVTAMGLARERETGTLEQLMVTPIHPVTLLTGKCLPFIVFGLIDVCAILILGSFLFAVPIRGSLAVVGLGAFLYLFSTLGIGILIATLSRSQQQAMLGALAFMMPTMLLSGFMSPIASMPDWLQPLTLLIPMRHFIEILRGCLLKGSTLADVAPQMFALALLGVVILSVSVALFRRQVT